MWFKKASSRRQAIREDLADLRAASPETRSRNRQFFLVIITFSILAACLQFWPINPIPYRVGQHAPVELIAPVEFNFVDPAEAAEARRLARENTEQVLGVDEDTIRLVGAQLIALRANIELVASVAQLNSDFRKRFPSLDDAALQALKDFDRRTFAAAVDTFKENAPGAGLRAIPLVTPDDRSILLKRRQIDSARHAAPETSAEPAAAPPSIPADRFVRLASTGTIEVKWDLPSVPIDSLFVTSSQGVDPALRSDIRKIVASGGEFSEPLVEIATDCVMALTRPIYRNDIKLFNLLAERNVPRFMPKGTFIARGETIANRGDLITPEIYQKLLQSRQGLEEEVARKNSWAPWLNALGLVFCTLVLTAAGSVYLNRVTPTMTLRRAWAMAGLLILTLAAAKFIQVYAPVSLLALSPTLLVAIILVIAENPRFALGMSALHGLLVAFTLGLGLDFYIPLLAGSAIFCFGLREIRTRGRLIEVGAVAGMAILLTVWALGLSRLLLSLGWASWADFQVVWVDSLWGAGAGVAVAMFALAILPSAERIFHITTAMTLLELCDANKPLLRRLSQEAPGTFHHSLNVGNMAEAAGDAIGANGLLCRVGAYYHDVGKLSKPQYFIENLNPGHANRHDKLSPAMSLLIIVGHVKDGIELAREYALPWVIHQFIAQHHGTTLVEYFFHAARKRAEQVEDCPEVSESEFRYPGPKPQTIEAAIVMICDSCESYVRAIDEPTPGRIEAAVHTMIMKRLLDGQFNECDITLRDLSVVEDTLVRSLAGIHHGRISYPSRPAARPADSPPDLPLSQPA